MKSSLIQKLADVKLSSLKMPSQTTDVDRGSVALAIQLCWNLSEWIRNGSVDQLINQAINQPLSLVSQLVKHIKILIHLADRNIANLIIFCHVAVIMW